MKKIFIFLLSVLLVIVQLTITSHFKFFGYNYGLIFVAVIVVGCIYDFKTSLINAMVSGIFLDTFYSLQYGVNIVSFLIVAVITFFVSDYMYKGNLVTCMVITFILTILSEILMYYILVSANSISSLSFVITRFVLPQAFLNTFVSVIIFGIYKHLYKKLKLDRQW